MIRPPRQAALTFCHDLHRRNDGRYQTTTGILRILNNNGNRDDLVAFMAERMPPVEEIQADEILRKPPVVGYLTISNALQWRLQYARVIEEAGHVAGIHRL
jgi:hypothetical protein